MRYSLCTKCKKNVAVIFITRIENGAFIGNVDIQTKEKEVESFDTDDWFECVIDFFDSLFNVDLSCLHILSSRHLKVSYLIILRKQTKSKTEQK